MSAGYGCALGDETHRVNWLITHLSPALTVSVCDDDFPLAVIPLLASSLGVDQGRLYESVKQFVDLEQAREQREHDQAEADAMASEPHPGPPLDEYDPEPTADQLAHPDDYDADGRPISADLT